MEMVEKAKISPPAVMRTEKPRQEYMVLDKHTQGMTCLKFNATIIKYLTIIFENVNFQRI